MKLRPEFAIPLAALVAATGIAYAGAKKADGYSVTEAGLVVNNRVECFYDDANHESGQAELIVRSPLQSDDSIRDLLLKAKILNTRPFYQGYLERFPMGYQIDLAPPQYKGPKVRRYGILNVNRNGRTLVFDYRSKEVRGSKYSKTQSFVAEVGEIGDRVSIWGDETSAKALAILASPFDENGCVIPTDVSNTEYGELRYMLVYSQEAFDKDGNPKKLHGGQNRNQFIIPVGQPPLFLGFTKSEVRQKNQ